MFLLCVVATFTLQLKASPGVNRGGVIEWEDPHENRRGRDPNYTVHRRAYDNDDKVWSDASTDASQSILGHSVHASVNVYSRRSGFLKGSYTVSATLNQDWVEPDNKWDGESGQWFVYLSKHASTSDIDWFDSYVPRDTIEYCLADGCAKAKDVRTRSVRWRTSVYIPW